MKKEWPVEFIAISYLLLILSGMILAGYRFPAWLWGLSLIADYPWIAGVCIVILSLAGLIPSVRKKIVIFLEKPPGSSASSLLNPSHILIFSLLASLSAFLFIQKCPMMGDGHLVYLQENIPPSDMVFTLKHTFNDLINIGLYKILFLALGSELYFTSSIAARAYLVWSVYSALGAFIFFNVFFRVVPLLTKSKSMSMMLASLVLTSGTMAIFTGFIELVSLRAAVLIIYLFVAVRALEKGSSPWPMTFTFFLCLGFYVAFIALAFSALYVAIARRDEIVKRPLFWLSSVLVPGIIFLILISRMVGLRQYLAQFFTGVDNLTMRTQISTFESNASTLYGLLSINHLLDLINVLLLHSPLNILAGVWIVYAILFFRSRWSEDKISVFLLFLLAGFGSELFMFNAWLGMQRDWDIYFPLGILLPLTAFRLWQVCSPVKMRLKIAHVLAILLPLAIMHLALWITTLHTRDLLIKRLLKCAEQKYYYSKDAKRKVASAVSAYCLGENYFPQYLIDLAGKDEDLRNFFIFRLGDAKDEDKLLELAAKWSDRLDALDLTNIGNMFLMNNKIDLSIYYFRSAWKENTFSVPNIRNMMKYYLIRGYSNVSFCYYLLLPEKEKVTFKDYFKDKPRFNSPAGAEEYIEKIMPAITEEIFWSGKKCLDNGFFRSAELEFLEALKMGYDSLKAYDNLGFSSVSLKEWDKAEQYYRTCRELSGKDWPYLYNLACVYAYQGKSGKASELRDRLSRSNIDPQYIKKLDNIIQAK
ncbi:MAG TPA: tetratricopeptide repeat protein [archaeon]|nr:tetratricopeptide repeat protein [archaeon]